ncbi:MAG TPA: MFS transporter [Acidimicrobiia bacterium]|jgi:MFS family permease|nr:MFS transporter [Acidimicrobiia bacterium]
MTRGRVASSSARVALMAAWALFAALGLLMVGNGLTGVVIGVRSELEGFTTTVTGLVMASYFAGFLVGSQVTPRIMARVGHIRVFAGLCSLVATAALMHALIVHPITWIIFRLVFGFAMAGLYVVVESWLNDMVSNANRGRVMALYMVVSMGGFAVGQLLIGAGDPTGPYLFILAGALMTLAVAPISLSINDAPYFELPPRARYRELWVSAPLGVVAAVGVGMSTGALIGMAGVYGTQVGMSVGRTGLFVAAAALGSVALQWPVGLMSDAIGRRRSILVTTFGVLIAGVVGSMIAFESPWLIATMFLLGGLAYPMYSLALSHVVDVLPPGQAVTGSVAVVFLTGVGAIFGPLSASVTMDLMGPEGFFWTIAFIHLAIGVYGLARVTLPPGGRDQPREPWLSVPARSTFVLRRGRWRYPRNTGSWD